MENSALIPAIQQKVAVLRGQDGKAYIEQNHRPNAYAVRVGSKEGDYLLHSLARKSGLCLKATDVRSINDQLAAHAELTGAVREVWYRVSRETDGIELDVGDDAHTRIRIRAGSWDVVTEGSETSFYRTSGMRSLAIPSRNGDVRLLERYVNLHAADFRLLVAWLSYTLAHPKTQASKFVILLLQGDQGSGKTSLCHVIQSLIDPHVVGVQTFPRTQRDLVIAAQHAHVLAFDNLRQISPSMADTLSIASTGGSLLTRQLYTDAEPQIHRLHVALVLNGIHAFVDQPDLAQRCLPLYLRTMDEADRCSEKTLIEDFQRDLPSIFGGLLDLIASVFQHLPTATIMHPERMIDFVQWLAAMESVYKVPAGIYQTQYSMALGETMRDSLLEDFLASELVGFVGDMKGTQWTGTPTQLLSELTLRINNSTRYSHDWPQNPIALSKRLRALTVGLKRQGIDVHLARGKERRITITRLEVDGHD